MKLNNRVALVTGATSGIGKAIAQRFAEEGARVAVNHRGSPGSAEAAAEQVQSYPNRGLAVCADVSERSEVERMIGEIVREFGRLDIVVNNAAVESESPFVNITDEDWHRVIGTNLYAPFVVAQLGARQMIAQGGGGRIITISSVHEDIPFANRTVYCAAKGALRMMTRNMALELATHRITANNIAPGAIATRLNQNVLDDPVQKKEALSEIPLARFGRPEEVASVAAFLASDEAEYVTGSTYYIDGGMTQRVTLY